MIKTYRKTATIKAEQFDPDKGIIPNGVFDKAFESTTSDMLRQMAERALNGKPVTNWHVATLEGDLKVASGDWIATGVNGEHWPIADDIFRKTYAELPVIPKYVAKLIEDYKVRNWSLMHLMSDQYSRRDSDYTFWIHTNSEIVARAWLDGYQVEEDV